MIWPKIAVLICLLVAFSEGVQCQESHTANLTRQEGVTFEFMAGYASINTCFQPGVDYFIEKETSGFEYTQIQLEVLYFSKYVCSYLSENSEDTYRYGSLLAFDLDAWPNGNDCSPIKAAAKNLGKLEEFQMRQRENQLICFDEYRVDD